jgi:hypothetical protein
MSRFDLHGLFPVCIKCFPNRDKRGSAIRKLGYRVKQERTSLRPNQRRYQSGRVLESVNHELIFRKIFAARLPRDSVYDFFVARKKWVHTDAKFK